MVQSLESLGSFAADPQTSAGSTSAFDSEEPKVPECDRSIFLVCGLGSVGQNCIAVLKEYGAIIHAIDDRTAIDWELPDLPDSIQTLHIGDCRKANVLEQAGVQHCRAILLVTNDERVNTEAAFAARLLNPKVRLVLRSSKQNLNQLLGENLGNFVAFEPTDLSASAFAFAALGAEVPAFFKLENQLLRVVKYQVKSGDRWCDRWQARGLNTPSRRLLHHTSPHPFHTFRNFHQWEADSTLQAGDTVIYLEMTDGLIRTPHQVVKEASARDRLLPQKSRNFFSPRWLLVWQNPVQMLQSLQLQQKVMQFWQTTQRYQTQRVALICGIAVAVLWCLGIILYRSYYPHIRLVEAFYAPVVLLLGGYGDLFGGVEFNAQPPPSEQMPWWLRLFSLSLTLAGTAFVGVLYALLTEALLTAKFQFKSRPPVPSQNHVVLIGLDRVGQRVATLLQELKQPFVGVSEQSFEPDLLPQMPLVVGSLPDSLTKVNLAQAQTTLVVLNDDLENLEIGLMVHAANPDSELVLRTHDQLFSSNIARLFPYAQVLCAPALSAEVFAAAAYGENVLSLFHLNNQTILVTEYYVEAEDTLNGLLLAEIAYGYGVVPILYQQAGQSPRFLPSDDMRIEVGDRLVILATSQSLQRIERSELASRCWQVQIDKALTKDAVFEGANEITRISGCSMSVARHLMGNLPAHLPYPLYKHQAQRLVRHLRNAQVTAHLTPMV